jgi:hypothetical protein
MATATQTTPAQSALAYTTEVKTFCRVIYVEGLDDKGEPKLEDKIVNEKVGLAAETSGKLDGNTVTEVQKFSVIEYFANSIAGAQELIPDESELVAMFNRGASTKQDNKFRQVLSSREENGDFSYNEQVTYDMREDLKKPTTRRESAFEKMQSQLSTIQLTPSMMAAFEELLAKRKAEMTGQ